jgi:hypothetical protein
LTLNLLNLTDGKSQVVTRLLSHDYPDNFVQAAQQSNEEGISADLLQNAFVCGIRESAWSSDGRYLAFAGQMDGLSSDVYLYDMNTHAIKRLSDEPEEVERIYWSQDGQKILEWSAYRVGEGMATDVYVISLDGEVIFKVVIYRGFLDWLYSTTYTFWGLENGMEPIQSGFVDIETGKVKIWDPEYDFLAVSADKQWLAASYSSGLYLVNLSTSKSIRVELPGEFEGNKSTFQAIGSGDQTFGFLNSSDNNLYFLSPEGKLTSTDINATSLSLSPDRQYLVAVGQKIHILKADGTPIRDVDLPTEQKNDSVFAIIWRPDASGIFFTVCDLLISDNAPNTRLYAMDLLTGGLMLVDPLSPTLNEEFFWVAKSK